jgi:uncharacterized cofD-like protein
MEQKRLVIVGGGTGSFVVLRGLKQYQFDLTAVVTMFDSGGSSGLLRDEFGVLPPGDVRRCLVALSDGERESILRNLFNYRFEEGTTFAGHNFGNLFLTVLSKLMLSDAAAIQAAGRLLNIQGTVLPVSLTKAHLCAELTSGSFIDGEANIDVPKHDPDLKIKKVFLTPSATLNPPVKDAIDRADGIIFGPGDLYTSLIPNLLVDGFAEAVQKSHARKIYIMNLMTKWGETNGFTAGDCAREVLSYLDIPMFDYIICNNVGIDRERIGAYAKEKKEPIMDYETARKYAHRLISADLVNDVDILRHDSNKLAHVISGLRL